MSNLQQAMALLHQARTLLSASSMSVREAELVDEINIFLNPPSLNMTEITEKMSAPLIDAQFPPDTCPRCRHHTHDGSICLNMASDNDCSCTYPTTEKVRIIDMAPGTQFYAEGVDVPGVEHYFRVTEYQREGVPILRCETHSSGAEAAYVDESTIRGVTPPS